MSLEQGSYQNSVNYYEVWTMDFSIHKKLQIAYIYTVNVLQKIHKYAVQKNKHNE